jgi:hypothetical protein
MSLMVYAPYGRTGVYMLQDYCRRLGVGTSEREIKDLVAVLEMLPQHHPLVALLRRSRDGVNADALADALLNPRDRAYSVPHLFELIEGGDLTFRRWHSQAPYLPRCGAIAATPHAQRLLELPDREQYAAMELWRGTMPTHSVIVSASQSPRGGVGQRISDRNDWAHYVPVRLPGTVCIQERLPPGAAAVLVSRYHTSPDLVLAIDAKEKEMLDAIDGRRSIAAIVHTVGGDRWLPQASSLFETLFWYDQVVFDTSGAQ